MYPIKKIVEKIKLEHCLSITFLILKSSGSLLFSWVLIKFLGNDAHVKIMYDVSIIMGISIVVRFGADQAILKQATLYFDNKDRVNLSKLLFYVIILCTLNSIIFFLVSYYFIRFETISNFQGTIAIWLVSISMCLMSFLKAFKKVHLSFFGEAGIIMLVGCIFLANKNTSQVIPILSLLWFIFNILNFLYVLRLIKSIDEGKKHFKTNVILSFLKPLPFLLTNSIFNYIQQWGVILIVAHNMNGDDASIFILALRVSYIFTAVLAPLSSYSIPETIRRYLSGSISSTNKYLESVKPLYIISSIACLFVSTIATIIYLHNKTIHIELYLSIFFFYLVNAFHLASGPANMYLAVLGEEKNLIIMRTLILIPFIVIGFFSVGNNFILALSFYILLQKIILLTFLKKRLSLKLI